MTRTYLFAIIFLLHHSAVGQGTRVGSERPGTRQFISKVEVFLGPSLSFNYGNKLLENYKGEHIKNRRLLKLGYTLGIGLYHRLSHHFYFNVRAQLEKKGTRALLNVPLDIGRLEIASTYTYEYNTIAFGPQILFGGKKQITATLRGYYGLIRGVKGSETIYDSETNTTSHGSFSGRSLRGLDKDGRITTLTFIPGLRSFNKDDFGVAVSLGYLFKVKNCGSVSVELKESVGLLNINNLEDGNACEKNHSLSLVIGFILNRESARLTSDN